MFIHVTNVVLLLYESNKENIKQINERDGWKLNDGDWFYYNLVYEKKFPVEGFETNLFSSLISLASVWIWMLVYVTGNVGSNVCSSIV